MSVGLYVGSRHDIIPLLLFPEIRWIYMDSLPVYNAGFEEDKYPKDKKKDMYFADVEREMSKAGFSLDTRNDDENLLIFKEGKREVYFFHSTFFPKCSTLQKELLKEVNYLYLSAYCPDRIILDMVCKTKPLTLLIWHVPLFYNWEKCNYKVDFQQDQKLTTFLLFNYVENVKYIYLNDKNTDNDKSLREQIRNNKKLDPSSVEKIPCINLLDYHQKETKTYADQPHYFKTLKNVTFKRKLFKRKIYTRRN